MNFLCHILFISLIIPLTKGNPTDKETERITQQWQSSLFNLHIDAQRLEQCLMFGIYSLLLYRNNYVPKSTVLILQLILIMLMLSHISTMLTLMLVPC